MKKRILSFLLAAVMLVGMIPMQIFAADAEEVPMAVDTSWYNSSAASGTVFEIADGADLRGAAKLSREGVTFAGYTLKLTANIDLNPGWNAQVKVESNKATLPDAPTVEFPGFATFEGTLDGNGKTLSGIYMMNKLTSGGSNLAFIEILNGTVKNLVINNSLIFADIADGVNDCKVAGIAARIENASALIDTVYADINVWYRCYTWERIAGIVARTTTACTIQNVAFVGTVGNMTPSGTVPSTSTGVYMSQLVSDANYKTALKLTNCSLMGKEYAAVATGKAVACNDKSIKTNVLVGTDVAMPAAVAAMNPTGYVNRLGAFNIWPSATADTNTASYDEGKQAYVKYYSKASEANYNDYLGVLANNGYVKCSEYTVGNNRYALYQKNGAYSVFVSFLAKVQYGNARMRVFVEPFGSEYDLNSVATTASVCAPQLWQLDVDNATADGGMSYVIRLTDGTFVVVDGGYSTAAEAKNLYKILSYNNVNGGKPVIRAWFLTHLHGDHTGALTNFANTYAGSVTVEGFYYNFPGNSVSGTDSISTDSIKSVELAMDHFPGAARYRKIHSGMTFGFAGVTATVLGTHEDVHQSYYRSVDSLADILKGYSFKANEFKDGNDTSTVLQFNIAGQKITLLADARTGMSKQLEYSYPASVLKSDVVQMAHHGYTGCEDALYEIIDAPVVLWPMDVVSKDQKEIFKSYLTRDDISANEYVYKNAEEIIPAYENVCLSMPYETGTYSGKGNQTVDLDDAFVEKLYRLATASDGADTSWYREDKNVYYIYDANDLLGFAKLAADGNSFSGKTVKLMADINLNPDWNADVTVGSKVIFPVLPVNTWPNIASFGGTLDGNGYTLSGLYKTMTVSGNKGAYGGLFNTLAGGTVKNLRISNSLILTTNTSWGSGNIHVGGIAGDVNEGSVLRNVYMDETVEVWFKSNEQCVLGGAYGYANGAHTVSDFIFAGVLGNTNLDLATNFVCPKTFYMATIIANQNSKGGSITNSLGLLDSIYTGKNYCTGTNGTGVSAGNVTASCLANARQSADWLAANAAAYGESFVWSDVMQSIVPKGAADLVNGSYRHEHPDNSSAFTGEYGEQFAVPKIFFQVTGIENGVYSIRFASGIDNIEIPSRVGFDITLHVGGKSYKIAPEYTLRDTVYTSLMAAGRLVSAEELSEEYEYLYTCSITDVAATDSITIDVAVVYECNGELITGETVTIQFLCGNGQII